MKSSLRLTGEDSRNVYWSHTGTQHTHTHTHTHTETYATQSIFRERTFYSDTQIHHTHTHTHTHTHIGFAILVRTFIDVYCFYTDLRIVYIALHQPYPYT